MAEALVSPVVEQLASIMFRELEQEVRLVVGVENAVDQLTSNLTAIKAVLADAETRQVKEASVKDWLEKLTDVTYDIEDALDDWEAAILSSQKNPGDEQDPKKLRRKVCSFLRSPCFCCKQVVLRHDIASKIKELNERLDRIARERDRYQFVERRDNPPIERPMTTSLIDITDVKGREEDKSDLIKMLLSEPSDRDGSAPCVLSIVGMGGIGKTTLAQFALKDDRVNDYFDKKIWVCVSDPFDETRVAKEILTSLLGSTPNVTELEHLHQNIVESIKDKRFLLILDDVWEENDNSKWYRLKQSLTSGSPKSKILVTTRKENVASIMNCSENNILRVGKLSDDECWLIIRKIAFLNRRDIDCKNLEDIGREISKKCNGLPLAAKVLGGILQFRGTREGWESILDSEIWELEKAREYVFAPLRLSYYDLPPSLKRCFSYCATFPKDSEIQKETLIELWMAQGYLKKEGSSDDLEIIGEFYFQNLVMRSLILEDFEDNENERIVSCKMHDIVHDFAQIVGRDECVVKQVNGPVESIITSLSSSKVRHLFLDCTNSTSSINSFDGTKKLRSLLIGGLPLTTEEELSRLFSESTHVRSLALSACDIPPSIRKLVRLRWLDLSWNSELKQLPEALCELQSLQTIDVSYCNQLKQLPLGIGKLINLRHLHNLDGPSRLPKGIGQLTGLRTLEVVDVGCGGDEFSLGDLKNLNQLRGRLEIRNLGKYNRHVGEAEQAELKKKEHITRLNLCFPYEGEERCTPRNEELLLEALEPSPYLEILSIEFYGGTTFPGWMISLQNLRSIRLSDCRSCEPSLGKLPSLETLALEMWDVKKVGRELLGIETQIGDSKSEISASSSSSPVFVAFPKLTTLEFEFMESWEEWEDYYDGTTKPPPIIIMPSLRTLEITRCSKLKALPDYILQSTTLHTLEIRRCDLLEERYNKEKGEDWSKISHISHVSIS